MRGPVRGAMLGEMKSVLVAYASKHGSTAEIAQAIADTLKDAGLEVVCREVGQVGSLEHYDAVVLGSAVYMARWRAEARHFLRVHHKALAQQPLWVFSSGPVGGDDTPADSRWLEPKRIARTVEGLGARAHVVFGGSLPAHAEGRIAQAMVKSTPPDKRDRRDWEQIRAWALQIAAELGGTGTAPSRLAS